LMLSLRISSSAADPVPVEVTMAECSAPAAMATVTMPANPFKPGQWIALRGVPLSPRVKRVGERVATGDGSTATFTFRTAAYPIQRGSLTVLVGGAPQGTDSPGVPYPGVGQLDGPGVGAFHGTVAINGKTVTLTSGSRVFDPRWQAFMPTIAGRRLLDVIGSETDSARLTLMAPAPDGPDQTFSLTSQLNYVTGVIEVTFTSPPGAGAPIVVSYNAEPSQWNGEHKVISATSKSVTYRAPNCTAAGTSAASGEAYALPLIYVAPASHTNCAYDGDGGQACTRATPIPARTNPHPKATLAGATQLLKSRALTVPYMIQLADANGTGLGGSTPLTDCYQPNEVTFSAVTIGGAPVDENEQLRVDRFPQSYVWVHGSAHPEMVLINGSGDCAASSRAVGPSEALRFDHMAARVDGFSLQGYGNRIGRGLGPSGISFGNFGTGYVENMICTGARDLNPKFFTQCVGAWDHSTLKVGGSHVVRNADWIRAVNQSNLFTADPSDQTGQNTTLDYFSSTPGAAMACTIMSNCQIDHLTAKFQGPGSYTAQSATEKSSFYYAERYVGSQCPNAACFDITIDAPNMTWESSVLGGARGLELRQQPAGCLHRYLRSGRSGLRAGGFFHQGIRASVIKGPDIEAAGGCVEVWNFGWQNPPGSQPPTCSSLVIRSESALAASHASERKRVEDSPAGIEDGCRRLGGVIQRLRADRHNQRRCDYWKRFRG
jgi:hypothetical protein